MTVLKLQCEKITIIDDSYEGNEKSGNNPAFSMLLF